MSTPARKARNKADKLFRDFIRERDNWTCQRCGVKVNKTERPVANVMHNLSRRHSATRCDPANAALGCAGCHMIMTGDHYEHVEFFTRWSGGEEAVQALRDKANAPTKANEAFWLNQIEQLKERNNADDV